MTQKLLPLHFPTPGVYGLNSQRKADILDLGWATRAENCVFDNSGRLAARKGWQHTNTTAITSSPDIKSAFEYVAGPSDMLKIVAAGNAIYKVDGTSMTDISGTITTPTADNWKFVNFNGKCIGFQSSHAPIVLSTTSGSFADITIASGSASSNEVLSAFGRLWILDGTSLKYCASLDETNWSTSAGSFDLSTVWLNGMDEGIALAEFNGYLIVFGKHSIVIWNNPWVPTGTGAIDVSNNMTLVENIAGVGCIARDSIQHIGDDIIFLSAQGIMSLSRIIQEKSMPLRDLSVNVRDDFNTIVNTETAANIKSVYSKLEGFYLITFPSQSITYYIDLKRPLQDGSYRITTWSTGFTALLNDRDSNLYLAAASGFLSKYTGYLDGVLSDGTSGTGFTMYYRSGWNDMGSSAQGVAPLVKLPKKLQVLMLGGDGQTHTLQWAFDYVDSFKSRNVTIASSGRSEWGVAEWGIGEWSAGLLYNKFKIPMSNSGQTIKFGFDLMVSGNSVALQSVTLTTKVGRQAA